METNKQVKRWVKSVQRGPDKKAADKLISHYLDEMFGYVFNRVASRENAKDITQQIFISMLQSLDKYDASKSNFRTWLYSIASRRVADYYRTKEQTDDRLVEMPDDDRISDDAFRIDVEKSLELNEINDFIDHLEQDRRQIFKLKVFEGFTFAEIAAVMQMPESTVKSSFYATQKLLKNEFREGSA
ncbi:MAG: sigma-70 family RNA polymerase sigma factor [Turicibacter sp.]|nr:sigma-70 family RNA polymerase sigma factor [Turicibacter sp.]